MENLDSFGVLDHFFAERFLRGSFTEEKALFLSSLMNASRRGDLCWIPDPKLCEAADLFPSDILEEGRDDILYPKAPVVRQGSRFYLQRNWVLETLILRHAKRLRSLEIPSFYDRGIFEKELGRLLEQSLLLPSQASALRQAFEHPFSLICGGPGTGKTYVSGFLIRLFAQSLRKEEKKKINIAIAAPTGKAAAHLQSSLLAKGNLDEAIRLEAGTIHRLLGLRPEENKLFSGRKIDSDVVIVDEASMLDVSLFAHLLEAIGDETRLVLIGDPDQLPPIEAGTLFAEMADLFATPLQRSLRTSESHLQAFAEAIHRGDSLEAERLLNEGHPSLRRLDWDFGSPVQEQLIEKIPYSISESEPDPKTLLKEMNAFRVLGALRQGPLGIDALNRSILEEMTRRIQPGQWGAVPIMASGNSPRLGIYNGSAGVLIWKRSPGMKMASASLMNQGAVFFPDSQGEVQICRYPPPFAPAFCLSIHKSQGSEFERVCALFPPGSEHFGREAVYTAATRAKKSLEIAISDETLRKMLSLKSRKISGFTDRWNNF